jgi:hypothetical protein
MRYEQCALLLACLASLYCGCRKDGDEEAPTVQILMPSAGIQVFVPDTLAVGVAVSDNEIVESLSVLVTDQFGVPIAPPVAVSVQAASATVQLDLPLISERIEDGMYILTILASDGANDGRALLTITVHAAPLRLRAIYATPLAGSPGPLAVSRIDSTGEVSTFLTLSELSGMAVDVDYLYTAGTQFEDLARHSLSNGIGTTMVPNPGMASPSTPYFSGLRFDPSDGRIYCGSRDGFVRGFTPSGTQAFTGSSPSGFYSERTVVVDDHLASIAVNPVTQERLLVAHARSSGTVLATFPFAARPENLFATDDVHALLFGEQDGEGVIQLINVQQGGVLELRTFPAEPLLAVVSTSPGMYLIALNSGLKRYVFQSNAATDLVTGQVFTSLAYDDVSGGVWAGSGNQIQLIDPISGATLDQRSLLHPVGHVLLQYNR